MKKSGLQKQISSIFNEAPVPVPDGISEPMPTEPDAVDTAAAKPTLAQRMAAAPTEAIHTAATPAMRPRPVVKKEIKTYQPKPLSQIKKALAGSNKAKMDPRQKKMTIMVGVLSVVFAGVLFISLGGLGQSSAKAADEKDVPQTSSAVQTGQETLQWHSPQPMPEQLRDPMTPGLKKVGQQEQSTAGSDQVVVKGIVFSKTRPTAIINDQIMAQGESINGITVVTISKEKVEFESNGQRWTQPVQR